MAVGMGQSLLQTGSGCRAQTISIQQSPAANPDPVCAEHQPPAGQVTLLLLRGLPRLHAPALNSAHNLNLL